MASVVMLLADLSPQSLTELRGLVRADPSKRETFRTSGGVELLLSKLGGMGAAAAAAATGPQQQHDNATAHRNSEILFTLAFCCDEEARDYIRDVGGLDTAVAVLRQSLPYAEAFECCSYAIGLLANYSYPNKVVLLRRGAVELLGDVLRSGSRRTLQSTSSRTLLNVTNVLKTLCEECNAVKDAAMRAGIFTQLCDVIRHEPQLACYAAGAAATIMHGCPAAQADFLHSDAFKALPDVVAAAATTTSPGEAYRCLYACLKGCPAAAEAMQRCPSFALIRSDLHKHLAAAAVEFAVKEVRNGVWEQKGGGGRAVHDASDAPLLPYCGAVAVADSLEGGAALSLAVDIPACADVCITACDLSAHRGVGSLRITLSEDGGVQGQAPLHLGGAMLASSGTGVLQWRTSGCAEQWLVQVAGSAEGVVVAAYANGLNEASRRGGLSAGVVGLQQAEKRVAVAKPREALAPPAPAPAPLAAVEAQPVAAPLQPHSSRAEVSMAHPSSPPPSPVSAPSEADALKQQVGQLVRRAGQQHQQHQQHQQSPDVQSLLMDNRSLRECVERLQREGDMHRQALAEQSVLVRSLVDGRDRESAMHRQQQHAAADEVSAADSTGQVSLCTDGTSASYTLHDGVAAVASQMQQLEEECVANTQHLTRFLSQIAELRHRMGAGHSMG